MDKGEPIEKMSTKFHNSLINTIADTVQVISGETGLKKVVFSGGTFHNEYLAAESQGRLEERGFEVYTHKQLPTNDGGICLGQAAVAYWRWHKDVSVNTL